MAWRWLGLVVPLLVLCTVWAVVRDAARRHPYFAVREVVLRHHGRLTPERIRAAAGIEPGTSIWDVDADRARRALEAEPWVRSARVRREPPHRVVIQVREFRPRAIVSLVDGEPLHYYVAANGRIFATLGPTDARDFPWVTGLGRAELQGDDALGPRAIRRALALLRAAEATPGVGPVSEIHVDRGRGLRLMPIWPTVPIELGWDGYEAKLGRLAEVLPLWAGREGEIAAVSCLFADEVVVRVRTRRPLES